MSQKQVLKSHLEKFMKPMKDAVSLIDELTMAEQRLEEVNGAINEQTKVLKALNESGKKALEEHEKAMQEMEQVKADMKTEVDATVVKLNFDLAAAEDLNRRKMVTLSNDEKELAKQVNLLEQRKLALEDNVAKAEKKLADTQKAMEDLKARL